MSRTEVERLKADHKRNNLCFLHGGHQEDIGLMFSHG